MYVHGDFVKLEAEEEEEAPKMAGEYDFEVKTQDHYIQERQKEKDDKEGEGEGEEEGYEQQREVADGEIETVDGETQTSGNFGK